MSALEKISFYQNQRDEAPNQALARELAETQDADGIREMADNLWNKNHNIRSDCLKVLYEIGYINPILVQNQVEDYLRLLKDKDNRMVWGAMIGLATIADLRPGEIWQKIDDVLATFEQGSVITVVWGVRALAKVAASDPVYRVRILPVLTQCLKTCIPRDVPTHAESMLSAVDANSQIEFLAILEARKVEMTPAQRKRLDKVVKAVCEP